MSWKFVTRHPWPLADIGEVTDPFGLHCLKLVAQVLNGHSQPTPSAFKISEGNNQRLSLIKNFLDVQIIKMHVSGSAENFKYFFALVLKLLMKNISNLLVRLFVISLLTFRYFSVIVSLFGAGAATIFTAPAPAPPPSKPFRRLRLRLRLRPKCVGSGGSGSGSASLVLGVPLYHQSQSCDRLRVRPYQALS